MFFRLLFESFWRQRRRKLLAGIAILLGTTAVTAMLALATTIGDRIHQELAVYGANIVVTPRADTLDVKVGGVNLKPATGGAYLHESDLAKLRGIFWANNITGVSPELPVELHMIVDGKAVDFSAVGLWFNHKLGTTNPLLTGAPQLHPWWKLSGTWPSDPHEVVVGQTVAKALNLHQGDTVDLPEPAWQAEAGKRIIPLGTTLKITGIVSTGDATDNRLLLPLETAQPYVGGTDAVARVDISARTKPEDAFAKSDPDKLSPHQRDIWYCRPYANSIAYQIREAIPGAQAEQVRRVEQSEGNVLKRISGLMWLISAAALLACRLCGLERCHGDGNS